MLTSYNLVFAAFMIGLGGLGDAMGRRRLYVLGQIVFTIGSGLAAVTAAPWQVIAARALQGLGAAALAPNALALILEHFPEDERGSALGIWGAAAGLGGALGPTVGGVVAQAWGWRVLFLANLPLGALVYGSRLRAPPSRPGRTRARLRSSGVLRPERVPARGLRVIVGHAGPQQSLGDDRTHQARAASRDMVCRGGASGSGAAR
jgi:MFS family permease